MPHVAKHFQLFLHLPGDIDALLADLFDGVQLALIHSDRSENRCVTEIRVRVGAQANLAGSDQRVSVLKIR